MINGEPITRRTLLGAGAALFGAGFINHQRSPFERLLVKAADSLLGVGPIGEVHKGKPPRLSALPVDGEKDR